MTQVLTDAEATRLAEIKRTHDSRILCTPNSPTSTLLGAAEARHNHRGELLTMLDKLLAYVDVKVAEADALRGANAELRQKNEHLKASLMGFADKLVYPACPPRGGTIPFYGADHWKVVTQPKLFAHDAAGNLTEVFPEVVKRLDEVIEGYNNYYADDKNEG